MEKVANRLRKATLVLVLLGLQWPLSAYSAVIASIKPIAFIAAALTEGVTTTEILLPDGASPHDYALRPSDLQRLSHADLVIWISPSMESFLAKPLAQLPAERQLVLVNQPAISANLLTGKEDDHQDADHDEDHHDHHDHHHHGSDNLHIWTSPQLAKVIAIAIHDKLKVLFVQDATKLDKNLQDFLTRIEQTQAEIAKMLVPVRSRGYFVFHDAYTYFENEFGLRQLGYFTLNPEIQPGAKRLHQIRQQLLAKNAVCVFAEPQFKPAVIDAVAKGTQVNIGILDPLGTEIALSNTSYTDYLLRLSEQFVNCLKRN